MSENKTCQSDHKTCRNMTYVNKPVNMSEPRKNKVDVSFCCHLCHACHARPTQNDGRCDFVPRLPRTPKPRPSAPPSAICSTPATQNDGRCEFVPRLPSKTTVDVSLCHACDAKCRGVTGAYPRPSAPPNAICSTPATQNDGRCEFVPRLPREMTVDVTKCHGCHAKCRGVTGA